MKPAGGIEQKGSSLLTKEENEQVFKMLGHKCQTLSTTVIQVYTTDSPEGVSWIKKDVGVLCLVRDTGRRSYFFRVYCVLRGKLVWEHELYNNMKYTSPRPFFHVFESEEHMVAFNFANEEEAQHLQNIVLEKLRMKEQKRMGKKNRNAAVNSTGLNRLPQRPAPVPNRIVSNDSLSSMHSPNSTLPNFSNKSQKKKSIRKSDIGAPLNFRHVSHVGWNPTTGFDLDGVSEEYKEFFKLVGVSENDLKDANLREYIYDFIDKNGGVEAVRKEISLSPPSAPPPPPVPARNAPTHVHKLNAAPPPPPQNAPMHPAPPPPPSVPPPPNVGHRIVKRQAPAVAPVSQNVPPPPPPPPVTWDDDETRNVTAPSNPARTEATAFEPRSALLSEIQRGTTLKHVDVESSKSNASSGDDTRGQLLNQIRQGVELKPVQPLEKSCNAPIMGGLTGALQRALAERAKAIRSDSSDSDDDDEYVDDEWND